VVLRGRERRWHDARVRARRGATGAALAVLAAALAAAPAARAEPRYSVVLLRPAVTDDVTADALARVRGELTAAGFEVSTLTQEPGVDVRVQLETAGRELQPIGTFAIVREQPAPAGEATAEIWVCDRVAGKSVIQNVRLDGPLATGEQSRAAVLAVQAVELLKASLAQYWMAAAAARRAPPPSVVAQPAAPPAVATYATAGFGVQAGVGWLDSVGAVSPTWQPLVRVSYGGARGWTVRLTLSGLGADARVTAAGVGTASIAQELAALDIVRGFRAGHRIQLVATLGAGGYRARIAGTGIDPYVGRDSDGWSLLTTAGAGVILRLTGHLALSVEAQALVTWPHTAVHLGGAEAGQTGWPAVLLTAGVFGTL
jgi:hypothetical protein